MAVLTWGGFSAYAEGVDRGVVYYPEIGHAWNGLTQIDEVVVGGEVTSVYFDGVKTIDMINAEDFALDINAITYPPVVEELDESSDYFGFSYRTQQKPGYLLHLVYNAMLFPKSVAYNTKSDTPATTDFGWSLFATPTAIPGAHPSPHLVVDTSVADPRSLAQLENILYGDATNDPRFPSTEEVVAIFAGYATLVVVDHGDGTWTATGPDEAIQMLDDTTFAITWPSVVYTSADTYTISSL